MAHHAELTLDPAFPIGEIDRRLFGSFVEHLGRCVYTGVYEPTGSAPPSICSPTTGS